MFFTEKRKRKAASGHHTAKGILRPCGTSRTTCLTFPPKGWCVPHLSPVLDSTALQAFAHYVLDLVGSNVDRAGYSGMVDFSPPGQKIDHDCKLHSSSLRDFAHFVLDGAFGTSGNSEVDYTIGDFA